jgi:hypothetical protein
VARKLVPPPSTVTGALGEWLREVHRVIESTPNVSLVSFAATDTPNSRVSGVPGDLAVNVSPSASTSSRLWTLGGSGSALTTQGWALVRIATV